MGRPEPIAAGSRILTDDPFVDQFLSHHGVKGMQWGVRRTAAQLASTTKAKVVAKKTQLDETKAKKVAARSDDFVKTNKLVEKSKTLGRASLSNKELKDVIARRNLEVDFAKLNPGTLGKGLAAIEKLTGQNNKFNNTVRSVQSTRALYKK